MTYTPSKRTREPNFIRRTMRRYASKHLIFFYVSFNKYLLAIIRGSRFYIFRDIVAAHFGASVSFADLMIARIEKKIINILNK